MKIYFAGAIRAGRDNQEIYQQIIERLRKYGKVLTEHIGRKNLTADGENLPEKKSTTAIWAIFKRPTFCWRKLQPLLWALAMKLPRRSNGAKECFVCIKNLTLKEYHDLQEALQFADEFFDFLNDK